MKGRTSLVALAALAALAAVAVVAVVVLHGPPPTSEVYPEPSTAWALDGFPGPATTGVPTGTMLQSSGSLVVKRDGTVLDGLDIDGCVDVKADDVTIRRSRIACARPTTAVRLHDGYRGLILEDVEIDGRGVVSTAVGFTHYTLRRVDIHDVIDGPRLGDETIVEDSYVHDLVRAEGSHNDALQITGGSGIVVRHNTLIAYREDSGDLFNAAVMVGSSSAPVSDVLIEGNYLDGGNYTVNFHDGLVASDIVGRDNTFGPHHRYGPLARGDLDSVTWTGQPWDGESPAPEPSGGSDQG